MSVHIIKLCVGVEHPEDLMAWQNQRLNQSGEIYHITRMTPKRRDEILSGGSIYWVMRGMITARQAIVGLERFTTPDGVHRCKLTFDRELILVRPAPRRPFQGWRYLEPADAPPDLRHRAGDDELPRELQAQLAELGLL